MGPGRGVMVGIVAGVLLALPGAALAAEPTVSPKLPSATSRIAVTWKADRAFPTGVSFRLTTQPARGCSSDVRARVRRPVRAGETVRATLAPRPRWCTAASLTLTVSSRTGVIATRQVPLRGAPLGTPVKLTLLSGSAVTTQVAGRPDRAAPLTGVIRGTLPGVIKLGTDIEVTLRKAALELGAPPADALCTATGAFPQPLQLSGPGSMVLLQSGDATLQLPLTAAPASLTGCAGDGAGPATTTLTLRGKSGPGGLSRLQLTGSVPNVGLAGGASATLAAAVTVNVDLSGRG